MSHNLASVVGYAVVLVFFTASSVLAARGFLGFHGGNQ
jgi:hypothetical protein